MRRSRKILILGFLFFSALGGVSYWLWEEGKIQEWALNQLKSWYQTEIAPKLPFIIEDVEWNSSRKNLIRGKIDSLSFILRRDDWKLKLQGSLQISRETFTQKWKVSFPHEVILIQSPNQPQMSSLFNRGHFLDGQLTVTVPKELKGLDSFSLDFKHGAQEWKSFPFAENVHLKLGNWRFQSNWRSGESLHTQLSIDSAELQGGSIQSNLSPLEIQSEIPFNFQPFTLGEKLSTQIKWKSGELLVASDYYSLEGNRIKLSADLQLQPAVSNLRVQLSHPHFTLHLNSSDFRTWKIKTPTLTSTQLSLFIHELGHPGPNFFSRLEQSISLKDGTLSASAQLSEHGQLLSQADLQNLTLLLPSPQIALRTLNGKMTFEKEKQARLDLHSGVFAWKHFEVPMNGSFLTLSDLQSRSPRILGELHLNIPNIPLEIAPLSGTLGSGDGTWSLGTQISLPALPLEKILTPFCIDSSKLPPIQVSSRLNQVHFDSDTLSTQGETRVTAFSGQAQIKNLEIEDYLSSVPELSFSSEWKGFRLDEFAKWSHFGEMDGTIEGFARDVSVVGWLPVSYDFRAEVKPLQERKIVFSAEAMKNVMRLITEEGYEQLPGLAKWAAFGWPSRVFGGYNLQYFGLALYADEGSILLETLDPPEILATEQKHYILYGNRFKIPLHASRYPVVLDMAGVGNFARRLLRQITTLSSNAPSTVEEVHPHDCVPKEFQ